MRCILHKTQRTAPVKASPTKLALSARRMPEYGKKTGNE